MSTALPDALPGFAAFTTHHCVTGSMRHVMAHGGVEVSEEMLLGLGAGVGFFYWHMKGATPMLLGRGNVHRPGTDGLEIDAPSRLGMQAERFVTNSARKAAKELLAELDAGRPVMVHVDMGFLPYLGMPDGYHFGGHVIVVAGRDGDTFVVADRDGVLHPVVGDDLRAARASKHKPFPPAHTRYRIQVERARTPTEADVRAAVAANAEAMLHGPITNLGVRGIRKAARLVPGWAGMLEPAELRGTCINNWIFIDATGGTGGGMFRLMYGRFLAEAGLLLGAGPLTEQADAAESLGRAWDEVGAVFQAVGTEAAPPTALTGLKESLVAIADGEEQLWTALATWAGGEGETTSP